MFIRYYPGTRDWYTGKCTGTVHWLNKHRRLHRIDGPAIEMANGYKEWWIDGQQIRIHHANGVKEWVGANGKFYFYNTPEELWTNTLPSWFSVLIVKMRRLLTNTGTHVYNSLRMKDGKKKEEPA